MCKCIFTCTCMCLGLGLRIRDLGMTRGGETVKGEQGGCGKRGSPALARECSNAREEGVRALLQLADCCDRVGEGRQEEEGVSPVCAPRPPPPCQSRSFLHLNPTAHLCHYHRLCLFVVLPALLLPPWQPLAHGSSPRPLPCAPLPITSTDPPLLLSQMAKPAVVLPEVHFFPDSKDSSASLAVRSLLSAALSCVQFKSKDPLRMLMRGDENPR